MTPMQTSQKARERERKGGGLRAKFACISCRHSSPLDNVKIGRGFISGKISETHLSNKDKNTAVENLFPSAASALNLVKKCESNEGKQRKGFKATGWTANTDTKNRSLL